ncbi:alcohol dehydrogenase [Viridothelium virens]|uniref:Alcohol dehydrogenase n=1 Tax=Viridothelium virens TaxID=1048519 RepID=A0A6A6HEB5_VIRVR|nr:alcohol dehydrogenase [Viridothelium virens]
MSTATLPKTYKAAVIEQVNGPFVFRDLPLQDPKEGQVLVKVLACGVCHADALAYQGHYGELPRIPGHEIIGDIAAVPSTEKKWKNGDRVGGTWNGAFDGTCKACIKGYTQMCDNQQVNGITRDGGYGEYVYLNTEAVVRVPSHIDPVAAAPLLCAGVTVYCGIKQMRIPQGEIVAVQGLGGLGHLALQFSRKMGYRTVALSSSASKRDFAMQLGASDYIDSSKEDPAEALNRMGGASLVLATAPSPAAVKPLINGLGPLGKLLSIAPMGDLPISTLALISHGRSVHGWPSGTQRDCEDAIAFADMMGVKCLVQDYPLQQAQTAFEDMLANKVRFRAVLKSA